MKTEKTPESNDHLEPKWPLFLKVNPQKQGLFPPKQGSFGFQALFFLGGGGPFVLFLTFYIKPAIFIEAGSFHPQKTLRSNPRMPFLPLLPRSLKINMLYIVQWFSHSLFENVFIPKLVLLKGNILYYLCHPMRLQLESKYIYIYK